MSSASKCRIVLSVLIFPLLAFSQDEKESAMNALAEMIGGKWVIHTKWENGGEFRQEQIFEWGLGKTIIKTTTYGTVNQETGEFGLRNEGIRAWDSAAKQMKFWEFDVFGGITTGVCGMEGNSFYYEYEYAPEGEMQIFRDVWTKIDKNTYSYQIGIYKDGKFAKVFLEVEAKRVEKE